MEDQINDDFFLESSEDPVQEKFSLPYHWDEDCHLILNENFYLRSLPEPEPLDSFDSPAFEIPDEVPVKKMKLEFPEINDTTNSESTGSTAESIEIQELLPKRTKTLDDQLDFIMGTCQKHQSGSEKTHKRNRKTPEQIKVLIEQLGEVVRKVTKQEIKEAAKKAGLTELQVYKWHYDRKCRLC